MVPVAVSFRGDDNGVLAGHRLNAMNAPTQPFSARARRGAGAARATTRMSLGLRGDGDEWRLLAGIERVFGVRLAEGEFAGCRTVGDLDEAIWRRLGRMHAGNTRRMGAMAFYALRRMLKAGHSHIPVTPSTPLKAIDMPPKVLATALEKREGLQMRFDIGLMARLGWLAQLGWLVLLWALLYGPFDWALPAILAVILGIAAMGVDRGAYARGETAGDLATRLARQNFAALASKGGRVDRPGLWSAVRQLAADAQGLPAEEIGRGTVLIGATRRAPKE